MHNLGPRESPQVSASTFAVDHAQLGMSVGRFAASASNRGPVRNSSTLSLNPRSERAPEVSSALPGERFSRRKFTPGYDVESVDDFLARAELGAVTAAEVKEIVFRSVFRGGYDEQEVDAALDALAKRLTADGLVGPAPVDAEPQPRSWLSRLLGS